MMTILALFTGLNKNGMYIKHSDPSEIIYE